MWLHVLTGPSCSTASQHHFSNKIHRNLTAGNGHSDQLGRPKPASFLSAGLATTITAAALGTTAFRKNKLLGYLHANRIQIAQVCPPRSVPVRYPSTSSTGKETSDEKHPLSRLSRRSRKRLSVNATDDIVPLTEDGSVSSCQNSLLGKRSLGSIRDLHHCESGQGDDSLEPKLQTVANQTILVSGSDDDNDEDNDDNESSADTTDSDSSDKPSTAYKFQRRRSRAVLYQLSGRFEQKSKRKTQLKRVSHFIFIISYLNKMSKGKCLLLIY